MKQQTARSAVTALCIIYVNGRVASGLWAVHRALVEIFFTAATTACNTAARRATCSEGKWDIYVEPRRATLYSRRVRACGQSRNISEGITLPLRLASHLNFLGFLLQGSVRCDPGGVADPQIGWFLMTGFVSRSGLPSLSSLHGQWVATTLVCGGQNADLSVGQKWFYNGPSMCKPSACSGFPEVQQSLNSFPCSTNYPGRFPFIMSFAAGVLSVYTFTPLPFCCSRKFCHADVEFGKVVLAVSLRFLMNHSFLAREFS